MPRKWLARDSQASTQKQIILSGEKEIEKMYHHQGNSNLLSSRTAFPPERHLYLQRGSLPGDSGLVLSTDAKPRLKWTPELHERFIEAVNQLGGPDKATPKTIMRLMGIPGLTLYHLKSHLQKYRLSKNLQAQANIGISKNGHTLTADRMSEEIGPLMSNTSCGSQTNRTMHISEALQMQIEVQRRLHEQLEVQRHLQLRIEAQGKYLQSVLEKAQETLEKQNSGSPGLDAVKIQLSKLISKVSNESPAFPCLQDSSGMLSLQEQTSQIADCSTESCLTSCEGFQKDQQLHNVTLGLKTNHGYSPLCTQPLQEDAQLQQAQPKAFGELNNCKNFVSSTVKDFDRAVFPVLSMSIDAQMEKGIISPVFGEWRKERDDEETYREQQYSKKPAVQHEKEKKSELTWLTARLDLNSHDENYTAPHCKKLDLNGFSCY